MDANQLAAIGFYFTKQTLIVRCAFCGVEVGYCEKGQVALEEHQRSSPFCELAKGLVLETFLFFLWTSLRNHRNNLPKNRDVCGSRFELRRNSLPERSKYYYLYFFFCYACVFDNSVLIFNVLLQPQVLELLNA